MHTKNHAQSKKHETNLDLVGDADASTELAPIDAIQDKLKKAEPELERELDVARTKLRKLEAQIKIKAASADQVIHKHAWKFIGAAAGLGVGVGFVAGALTFRK